MTANPTTALATIDPRADTLAFEPRSFAEVTSLAQYLAKSGLMPKSLPTPEAVTTAIVMGRELGLTAMQSVRSIHVIEGKPALSSALIVAICKSHPSICLYFRNIESTDDIATYETQRAGEPEPQRLSFTSKQAAKAGLYQPTYNGKASNHTKFPAAMLRARAETALARMVYPDLVMGLYDPDELVDREPPRDVTPKKGSATIDADATVITTPVVEDAVEVDPEPARVRAALEAATTPEELAAAWKSTTKEVRKHDDLIALKDARKAALSAPVVVEKPVTPPPATPAPATEGEDF